MKENVRVIYNKNKITKNKYRNNMIIDDYNISLKNNKIQNWLRIRKIIIWRVIVRSNFKQTIIL